MEEASATRTASEFAASLVALRKKRRWSQQLVAEKLGLSNRTICKWETGRGTPKFTTLLELSSLFEVSLDELVGQKAEAEGKIP